MNSYGRQGFGRALKAAEFHDGRPLRAEEIDPTTESLTVRHYTDLPSLIPLSHLSALEALKVELIHDETFTSLAGIENNRGLRDVTLAALRGLRSVDALSEMKSIETLEVSMCEALNDLSPLRGCTRLKRATLYDLGITSLDFLEDSDLEKLELWRCPALRSIKGLRGSRDIRSLHWHDLPRLTSLEGVENLRALESVDLRGVAKLDGLAPLRDLDKLDSVWVEDARALTSLDGLQGKDALQFVTLLGCTRLTDLSALAGAKALVHLVIVGAEALTDVSVLASLPALSTLDLYGAAALQDVSALAALQHLKVVSLGGTGVKRAKLPANVKPVVTFARDRDLFALAARGPVARPAPVKKDIKSNYLRLKKLLLSKDVASVDQGIELAASLAQTDLFDGLLDGVTFNPNARRTLHLVNGESSEGGMLEPNRAFTVAGPAAPFRDRALLGLLWHAPEGCAVAAALKGEVEQFELDGGHKHTPLVPIDLAQMTMFPRLRALTVNTASKVQHPEALAALKGLVSLTFLSCAPAHLKGLTGHAALQTLTLSQHWESGGKLLDGLTQLPELQKLTVIGGSHSGSFALRDLPKLRDAMIHSMGGLDTLRFEGCPALASLDMLYCNGLHTLDVSGLASLTTLCVRSLVGMREVRGLADLGALESLNLSDNPRLTTMPDLGALKRLREVDLDNCPNLTDLSALNEIPSIKRLSAANTGADLSALSARLRKLLDKT